MILVLLSEVKSKFDAVQPMYNFGKSRSAILYKNKVVTMNDIRTLSFFSCMLLYDYVTSTLQYNNVVSFGKLCVIHREDFRQMIGLLKNSDLVKPACDRLGIIDFDDVIRVWKQTGVLVTSGVGYQFNEIMYDMPFSESYVYSIADRMSSYLAVRC